MNNDHNVGDNNPNQTGSAGSDGHATQNGARPLSDPRFLTGQWRGYWLQPPRRVQYYMQMALIFENGVMNGRGVDVLGDFEIVGAYDINEGSCTFQKRYDFRRVVTYGGYHVDQKPHYGISGDWCYRRSCDRFWIARE